MKYAKIHRNKDAQTDTVVGGNLETDIPDNVQGGVASLDTMQEIPDDFEGSELAKMGQGPSGLEDISELVPPTPAEETPPAEQTPENQGGKDPAKDAAYWQSQHDKREHEHKLEMEQMKNEFLQQMQQVQNPQKPAESAEEIKPPQRPADFDAFEAFNAPESESYKWREANEEFKMKQIADSIRSEFKQESEKKQQEIARKQALANIQSEALRLANNDVQAQSEFIAFLNSPKSYSLEFMYQAFQASKSNAKVPSQGEQNILQNQRNNGMPTDTGIVNAEAPRILNEEQKFNEARKRNTARVDY